MVRPFKVIKGRKDEATYVCTWCAEAFFTKTALDKHWKKSARCGANKGVSNQTQTKYNAVEPSEESTDP